MYSQAFPENLEDSDGCALIVYITGITMKNSTDSPDLMESKGDSLRWVKIRLLGSLALLGRK